MKTRTTKFLNIILFCICSVFISNNAFNQYPETETKPLAVDQEKIELRNELNSRILYVEQTLDAIQENQENIDMLTQSEKLTLDQLETSLKIYKNSLITKKELIPEQTNEEWQAFEKQTKDWCNNVETGISRDLQELEQELTIY